MTTRACAMLLAAAAVTGCATMQARPRVFVLPNNNLSVTAYDADKSRSSVRAQDEAGRYCWDYAGHKHPMLIGEATVYQGAYDPQIAEAAKAAGRVGDILGNPEASKAGGALSSPTDYKTTVEFRCQ